jgi:hypothetical protein
MYLLNKNLKLLNGVLWPNNSFWLLHLACLFLINQEQNLNHNIITLLLVFSKPRVQFLEEFGTYFFLELEFCVISLKLKLTPTMEALAMKMLVEVIVVLANLVHRTSYSLNTTNNVVS